MEGTKHIVLNTLNMADVVNRDAIDQRPVIGFSKRYKG